MKGKQSATELWEPNLAAAIVKGGREWEKLIAHPRGSRGAKTQVEEAEPTQRSSLIIKSLLADPITAFMNSGWRRQAVLSGAVKYPCVLKVFIVSCQSLYSK